MMPSNEKRFYTVADSRTLEDLFRRSHSVPVLLFKHSNACPVSSAAYQQMSQVNGEVAIVVVQSSRDVSREVEDRTGIRHESPQAMVLRDGAAVWSASHFGVTAEAVEQALRET
jgi:bacillithiol system protein YtxJ